MKSDFFLKFMKNKKHFMKFIQKTLLDITDKKCKQKIHAKII